MTAFEQRYELARLDGHSDNEIREYGLMAFGDPLSSYDIIMRLTRKLFPNQVAEGYFNPDWEAYEDNLKISIGGSKQCWCDYDFQMATPAQRAQAILKTFGKWKE